MDEIAMFARHRPDVTELAHDERDRIWDQVSRQLAETSSRSNGDDVAYEAQRVNVVDHPAPKRPGRHITLVAAIVVTVLGAGSVAMLDRRDHVPSGVPEVPTADTRPPLTTSTSSQTATSTATSTVTSVPPSASTPAPSTPLSWQRAANTGSLGRSQVSGITAGPGGFVATGMGFDDGRNQGRVWFSTDGTTWGEPALDVFDAKAVSAPAATSEAFYVVAQTNQDRLPNSHEGDPSVPDAQLYRSVGGRSWSPIGSSLGNLPQLGAAGDTLLRVDNSRDLSWSVDGLTWTPATFPASPPDLVSLGDGNGLPPGPGPWYLYGIRNGNPALWRSDDAHTWTEIPAPPGGGRPVIAAGGLVSVFNLGEQHCNDARRPGTATTVAANPEESVDPCWACASALTTSRYDQATGQWTNLEQPGPGPSPTFARLAALVM